MRVVAFIVLFSMSLPLGAKESPSPAPCGGIVEFIAHRGHPSARENTAEAVKAALQDEQFTGAEIDVQLLADGVSWGLHHDLSPSPIVQGVPDRPLRLITRDEWLAGRVMGRTGRRVGDTAPALLGGVLGDIRDVGRPDWTLFVEAKGLFLPGDARNLATRIGSQSFRNVVISSLDLEALEFLRKDARYSGPIAWVVLPPASLEELVPARDARFVHEYGKYVGVTIRDVEHVVQGGTKLIKDPTLLDRALEWLGAPLMLILERNMLDSDRLVLKLKSSNVVLYTYAIEGSAEAHALYLGGVIRDTGLVPRGVITSMGRDKFCAIIDDILEDSEVPVSEPRVTEQPSPGPPKVRTYSGEPPPERHETPELCLPGGQCKQQSRADRKGNVSKKGALQILNIRDGHISKSASGLAELRRPPDSAHSLFTASVARIPALGGVSASSAIG